MRGAAVTQAEPDERRECSADVRISLDVPHKVALLVSGGGDYQEVVITMSDHMCHSRGQALAGPPARSCSLCGIECIHF